MLPRSVRGFTLLEVLAAFVLLAAAAGILYRTYSTNLNNVAVVSAYSEAIAIAEAKLGAIGLEHPLEEGEESGTTDDHRFEWRVVVQPYNPPGSPEEQSAGTVNARQLLRVTVTVAWDRRGLSGRSVELSTLRLAGKSTA
jgi:general secretion pathway protein I